MVPYPRTKITFKKKALKNNKDPLFQLTKRLKSHLSDQQEIETR